jgi:hypothetical protein
VLSESIEYAPMLYSLIVCEKLLTILLIIGLSLRSPPLGGDQSPVGHVAGSRAKDFLLISRLKIRLTARASFGHTSKRHVILWLTLDSSGAIGFSRDRLTLFLLFELALFL